MKRIQGIVFDFGGVISMRQDPAFYAWVKARWGWTRQEILRGWGRYRSAVDGGTLSAAEMYLRIAVDLECALSAEEAKLLQDADYRSWAIPNHETFQWAQDLKANGYEIGILTNMPEDFIPYFDAIAKEFRALAKAELISGIERMVKPNAEIYDLMQQRMALPAEQLLFLDDTLPNVEAARRCGWQAAQFTTVAAARALVERLR
ncbi:MAG: HAD-IA family hydrolase [Kiritimatiellia bacterium]